MEPRKRVAILGTRGIPARHGGFETFAEHLALYLVARDWDVTVYCQENAEGTRRYEDDWRGVHRVVIPVGVPGAFGTMVFDLKSVRHCIAARHKLVLTLGYNTALFCGPYRLFGVQNLMNMDGMEWTRDKWRPYQRAWLRFNERCGCVLANGLIADHPEIARHLETRARSDKVVTIPYGANEVAEAPTCHLEPLGLTPGQFATVIARPEPENSILEIVRAWSRRDRGRQLVMLGSYFEGSDYHRRVRRAASGEVLFPGAIYDRAVVEALRLHGRLYIHGHRVGGTNPSLVEALGAGSAVLAHDNRFNRWVAGDGARYFHDEDSCARELDLLLADDAEIDRLRAAGRRRFREEFTWDNVLGQYERVLTAAMPR